jgi:hypothetical protein
MDVYGPTRIVLVNVLKAIVSEFSVMLTSSRIGTRLEDPKYPLLRMLRDLLLTVTRVAQSGWIQLALRTTRERESNAFGVTCHWLKA